MSYEESLRSISLEADSSVGFYTGVAGTPGAATSKQYCAVKVTGANTVGLATSKSDKIIGVLQNKPQTTGAAATVGVRGISNMKIASEIAAGDMVTATASGEIEKTTTAGESMGIALTASATAHSLVAVLLDVR